MMQCSSCGGTGKTRCSSCGGRRYHSRLTMKGDMDMTPCAVCGASGRMRCPVCGGRGTFGQTSHQAPPPPRERRPGEDVLAGRWNASQGGYYVFAKKGDVYEFTEQSVLGQTGSGTATLRGNVVTMNINNILVGQYRVELQLSGDTLQGSISMMGMTVPFILTRG